MAACPAVKLVRSCAAQMICLLIVLTFFQSSFAFGGAYWIGPNEFQTSDRNFPECKLPDQPPFVLKVIALSDEFHLVEIGEAAYCIVVRDKAAGKNQSMIVSRYRFVGVYVGDIMRYGQVPVGIWFSAGFFKLINVTIFDGKFIVSNHWGAMSVR
jgi:hypothetical protein